MVGRFAGICGWSSTTAESGLFLRRVRKPLGECEEKGLISQPTIWLQIPDSAKPAQIMPPLDNSIQQERWRSTIDKE